MHSTIQTGLYTPNIFNYEHNFHHPNSSHHHHHQHPTALSNSCHHFPPPPHGHHKHKTNQSNQLNPKRPSKEQLRGSLTQLNQIKANNASSSSSSKSNVNNNKSNTNKLKTNNINKKNGGVQSVNASLLAINEQDSKQRYDKFLVSGGGSTLNILKSKANHLFSSNYNINQSNTNENSLKNSNSVSNVSILNSNRANSISNLNYRNDEQSSKITNKDENHVNQPSTVKFTGHHLSSSNNNLNASNSKMNNDKNSSQCCKQYKFKKNRLESFKSFWECTKPCGVLTCVFGIFLIGLSALGFFVLFDVKLCSKMNICSNGLLQISSVSNLVIGVVLAMIGVVIVVYSKKDTQVIIATGKHFENLSLVVENNKGNLSSQINAGGSQHFFVSSLNNNINNSNQPTVTTTTTTPTISNNNNNLNDTPATGFVSKSLDLKSTV